MATFKLLNTENTFHKQKNYSNNRIDSIYMSSRQKNQLHQKQH